ncbi:hypothetical protein FHT36_000726 [Xanthobacter sp. SG618]|uniref:hypothetical protein n=1 Tax=Xanthobacter sp. SG618 TaxID=2587121 RepID=UPI00145E7411|nr:hypothetical protein [Xanthobacter sp. SG618]NMN56848.1 hypothetical protein [Xanthobacter sp. SG618]
MAEGVLLDTNVWRYLADADAYTKLLTNSHRAGVPIVVSPAAVYESLAIPDPKLRQSVAQLISRPRWHRLMPDAFSECEEIRAEIQRIHPEWLSTKPDLHLWEKNRRDWSRPKRGFWDRVRNDTDRMARLTRFPHLEEARSEAERRRKFMLNLRKNDWLNEPFVNPKEGLGGREGKPFPLWRFDAANTTFIHLKREGGPYRDWLIPWLDASCRITQRAWNEFWFYEVGDHSTLRQRLRSRVEWLQAFQKISPGAPGDSQLASYLTDAAFIATADKRFFQTIRDCQKTIDFKIASPVLLSGGKAGVEELIQWFRDRSPEHSVHINAADDVEVNRQ